MLGTLTIDPVKTRTVSDMAGDCETVSQLVRLVCIASSTGLDLSVHSRYELRRNN